MTTNDSSDSKNKVNRPTSITVIAVFYWITAVVQVGNGVTGFGRLLGVITEERQSIPAYSILAPIGNIVLAIFFVIAGWGLWQLKPWARRTAIPLSGLMIAASLFLLVLAIIYGQFLIPYNMVFHGLVLMALFNINVKRAFLPS